MSDSLKRRFEFPSRLIKAQTVRSLVAAVLKEKTITQSCSLGPAAEALWEQCCSDCIVVRSDCCNALVLLVEQGQADLQYVLNRILNLLPSTRNGRGLIKVIGRLLQMQADKRDREVPFTCPYNIRSNPHPYITVLENCPDSWTALLMEMNDILQEAMDRDESAYVTMFAPFLRYLYCEPQRLPQHAMLRHSLLKVLLPTQPGESTHSNQAQTTEAFHSLVSCLYDLVSYMQVDTVEAVLEIQSFVEALLPTLGRASRDCWRSMRACLILQLLSACRLSLKLIGECHPLLRLLQRLLPIYSVELPVEEVMVGLALLLLEAPASQQTALLSLALTLAPPESERTPWGTPVLLLPLLQVVSCSALMEPLTDTGTYSQKQILAQSLLQSTQQETLMPAEGSIELTLPLSPWHNELQVVTRVLRRVTGDLIAAREWLLSVISNLSVSKCVPKPLTLIVAHLIVTGHGDVCQLALQAAVVIANMDPSQVTSLLPVLLFKLGKKCDPALTHTILYSLPSLGTHKLVVPQVLHTLQILASTSKLRGVALRLMTALWEKQDRVYPELQRLMGQLDKTSGLVGKEDQWEQVLARATCIRDICKERPYQHGGDMLAAITHILTQCTRSDQAPPAALALQGLHELCRAEVVDICSMWRILGPKLSCDSRPLVIKTIADLLALVPQLTVKSEEYEKLKEQVTSLLWGYALNKDHEVANCGYRALSYFSETAFTTLHLPEKARPSAKLPESEKGEQDIDKGSENEQDLSVPGSSYVKLIGVTSPSVLPALESLLTSLVKQEMSQMPRGVYHTALKGGILRSDQLKTMAGIPAFMLKTYEKNKQPGLKPGLAAGLLLSYDLPVQTDRNGQPINRFLLSQSRSYQQMLSTLIHEVNIQPSEWHRALLLPKGWQGFMSRAFHAVLQGRRAELEMQKKQAKESLEELQYKQHCVWLWVRDQLTDVVKSASKDSPVVQGNSILALSGLATVLAKYESNLHSETEVGFEVGTEIIPTATWLAMLIDTLLSIINSTYQPKGLVFPWFQHRSYSGENTASIIARSCAALALSQMVPVLVSKHKEYLPEVLSILRAGLPDSPSVDESQTVQFHSGLALGLVLCSLHEERLSDVSDKKMNDMLRNSLDTLEACCFDTNLEYNMGCVLGMGLVLVALCGSRQVDHKAKVSGTLDKLLLGLQESANQGRMLQEVFAYSLACVAVSAFTVGFVSATKAEEVMNTIRNKTEESQQTPGFSLALGLVVHGLSQCGHGKVEDIHPRLLAAWIKILLAEDCPTMQRLAAVNGLMALVGSESNLTQLKNQSEQSSLLQSNLNEVIQATTQIITYSRAIGLQSNSACLLGHLHLVQMSSGHSPIAVPQGFSYLTEKSVIRSLGDFITEAGRKGPEVTFPELVKTALGPLAAEGKSFQYPPINWSAILSPLMRLNFGEEVQHLCMELAASQAQSSQSASLFLGSWLCSPLVYSLSCHTQGHLYHTLSVWMKYVPEEKLKVFVETLGVQQFHPELQPQRLDLCLSLLRGLAQAMALPNPPNHCWAILCSTTEKIFAILPNNIQDSEVGLYLEISKCLSKFPDTEIDRIAHVTETQVEKTCFVLAHLTSQGRVPLLGLNSVISAVLHGWPSQRVGWLLLQTFHQCRLASSPNTGVSQRMEWLLELMGHIRNIAYGATVPNCGNAKQMTQFLIQVFAAAVVSWSDHTIPLLIGIRAQWLPWKQEYKLPVLPHSFYGDMLLTEQSLSLCLLGLPPCLKHLLVKEPWCSQSPKFIDWLLSITEGPEAGLSPTSIIAAKAALLALRTTPEFKKKAVWTRAYGW
ncbi:focadhesin isoform X1 [Hypomesus transpacificus]|uniref:focadhesin isoform X1 n=1 Tax=Hypomesus transpacificus TaxID=137520 RepID=UPI001F0791E4|nr:focadhesin isoform X1 [Hypomesus transpacificus]XP_046905304.1 focadhesin isoform X1 [Hypomesus transpacificus]